MKFSFFFITYQALLSNNRWLSACVFPLPRLRTVSTIPRIASISPPFEDGSEHGLHLQNLEKKKTKIISNFADSPFNSCWRDLWPFTKWYPVRKLWRETVLLLALMRSSSVDGNACGWEKFPPILQTFIKVLVSTLKRANTSTFRQN